MIIPSDEKASTEKPLPSVVSFFADGSCLIGKSAVEQSFYNPEGTVSNVKRLMGSGQQVEVFGKSYLPQFISALILLKIKIYAEKLLGEKIEKAVITVPAYFNDNQRQATRDAGKIAGLDVLHIIPEPIAASIAFGINRDEKNNRVMVFDLGAGTLDVSIIEIGGGFHEVLSTSGNSSLGGIDMDTKLMKLIIKKIKTQYPSWHESKSDKISLANLAESIKIELSTKESVTVDYDILDGVQINVIRSNFENLIADIIDQCKVVVMDALKGANLISSDIDKVVLVGGPTKIPIIQKTISELIRLPEPGIDPTFTVASGAAIQGAVLANAGNLPVLYQGLTLVNVTPLDLGEMAKYRGKEILELMIKKNTPYPIEVTKMYYVAKPMQTEVQISVWQGDFEKNSGFLDNVEIGEFWLRGLRKGVMNKEIEVTYKLDADGILTVRAREIGGMVSDELVIDKFGNSIIPPPQLEFSLKEAQKIEKRIYRDVLSPYEIPIGGEHVVSNDNNAICWMCDCLNDAKQLIIQHHIHDAKEFFENTQYEISLQDVKQYAYAFIQLGLHPYYPIGVHVSLSENTPRNYRMLKVVLVHELLHALHPDWGHNRINPAERRIANMGNHFDALEEMKNLFLSGKMSFCNNDVSIVDHSSSVKCS
jgi:molecular chaperone DnaK